MEKLDERQDVLSDNMTSAEKQQLLPFTDPLWTVEDVANYLKLQPETIRSMARRGELPALKIGKVWRFQKNSIHNKIISLE